MSCGARLKELRKIFGYTQEQAAERLGVQRNTYSHWENDVATPSIEFALKCAELYNVTLDYLAGRTGAERYFIPVENELIYWQDRALKAENKLSGLKNSLLGMIKIIDPTE